MDDEDDERFKLWCILTGGMLAIALLVGECAYAFWLM
jgi:hypothetical protein